MKIKTNLKAGDGDSAQWGTQSYSQKALTKGKSSFKIKIQFK